MQNILQLPEKAIILLQHIKRYGKVSTETRPFVLKITYYNYLWVLRDLDLILNAETNGDKTWILSDKGKCVLSHLEEVSKLLEGKNNGS